MSFHDDRDKIKFPLTVELAGSAMYENQSGLIVLGHRLNGRDSGGIEFDIFEPRFIGNQVQQRLFDAKRGDIVEDIDDNATVKQVCNARVMH